MQPKRPPTKREMSSVRKPSGLPAAAFAAASAASLPPKPERMPSTHTRDASQPKAKPTSRYGLLGASDDLYAGGSGELAGTGASAAGSTGGARRVAGSAAATEPGVAATKPGVAATEPGVAANEPGVAANEPGVAATEPGVAATDEPGVAARSYLSAGGFSGVFGS
jgi:hypothetical protein